MKVELKSKEFKEHINDENALTFINGSRRQKTRREFQVDFRMQSPHA